MRECFKEEGKKDRQQAKAHYLPREFKRRLSAGKAEHLRLSKRKREKMYEAQLGGHDVVELESAVGDKYA